MKTTKNIALALLVCAALLPAAAYAGALTDTAVQTAANANASVDSIALAAAAAAKSDKEVKPADVLTSVLAARPAWTSSQISALYKAVLIASGLNASVSADMSAFKAAGYKATETSSDGVKLLAVACGKGCSFAEIVSVIGAPLDATRIGVGGDSAVLRSRGSANRFPGKPTPPVVSTDN